MSDIIVNSMDIASIEKVYEQIKDGVMIEAMHGLVCTIAAVLIIQKIIKTYREAGSDKIDAKKMFDLLWIYAVIACIIALIPFLLKWFEGMLADMQSHLVKIKPVEDAGIMSKIEAQMANRSEVRAAEGPTIMSGLTVLLDYAGTFIVAPVTYFATKYLYSFMMVGRYFYLLMLEIISPIAVVMLLNEKTEQYFMTWAKHMLICYLMIPFFILANSFGDMLMVKLTEGWYSMTIALLASFFIKLTLFNIVKSKLFNLI